jgi:large subunit ribosomal protein L24
MARIKQSDTVQIIAGKDKGKTGKVLRVVNGGERIIVEKANLVKRHQRPSQAHPQGGIIEKEAPLHASNVMLVGADGTPGRVGYKIDGDAKTRINPKTGNAFA